MRLVIAVYFLALGVLLAAGVRAQSSDITYPKYSPCAPSSASPVNRVREARQAMSRVNFAGH